jgi:hypothetical protein
MRDTTMDASAAATSPEPSELTAAEQAALQRCACALVAAAARHQATRFDSTPLGPLAARSVVGVFVTLRRHGALRACIGNFAESIRLEQALERAATGAARHDPRFPPIDPAELPDLTVEVSVLHAREQLTGSPRDRLAAVEIGRHGLDIQYQGRVGLLLPSVAVDHGWDAPRLLAEVCRKAGLPLDAWQEPEATLYRFSALHCSGPWTDPTPETPP